MTRNHIKSKSREALISSLDFLSMKCNSFLFMLFKFTVLEDAFFHIQQSFHQ